MTEAFRTRTILIITHGSLQQAGYTIGLQTDSGTPDVRRVRETASPKVHKTHQHKHQSTLKNIIRKKIQLLKSGLERSTVTSSFEWQSRLTARFDDFTRPLYNTDECALLNVQERLRFHQEALMS